MSRNLKLNDSLYKLQKALDDLKYKQKIKIPATVKSMIDVCCKLQYENTLLQKQDKVYIALVGAYSSGKSCFINSLLGSKIAPENPSRTTCVRTNFTYGPEKRVINDSTNTLITIDEYQEQSKTRQCTETVFTIEVPNKNFKNIIIMDTPGFDAPEESGVDVTISDAVISRKSAENADIVFFVFDANDGGLKKDSLEYLCELNDRTKPDALQPLKIYLIMNKSDKKSQNKRTIIAKQAIAECEKKQIKFEKVIFYSSEPDERMRKTEKAFLENMTSEILTVLESAQTEKNNIINYRYDAGQKVYIQEFSKLLTEITKFANHHKNILKRKADTFSGFEITEGSFYYKLQDLTESLFDEYCASILDDLFTVSFIFDSGIIHDDYIAEIKKNTNEYKLSGNQLVDFKKQINELFITEGFEVSYVKHVNSITSLINNSFWSEYDFWRGRSERFAYGLFGNKNSAKKKIKLWRYEFQCALADSAPEYMSDRLKAIAQSVVKKKLANDNVEATKLIKEWDQLLSIVDMYSKSIESNE